MIWVLFIVVAVLVLGAFAALLAGRIGYDPMAAATTTAHDPRLSDEFHAHDVTAVRFDTALRGYRMDQVDVVLDQLRERIAQLESDHTDAPVGTPVRDTAPDPVRDTAPDPVRETTPDPVRETTPDPVRDTAPDPVRDTAPGTER